MTRRPGEYRRARLHSPPWHDMIMELVQLGITLREIQDRMGVELSPKLLRHYRDGGQPNFPRGDALLSLWSEVTGKSDAFLPMLDWSAPHRVSSSAMVQHERCEKCGQILRTAALRLKWEQMSLHKEVFGGLPNWPARGTKTKAEA